MGCEVGKTVLGDEEQAAPDEGRDANPDGTVRNDSRPKAQPRRLAGGDRVHDSDGHGERDPIPADRKWTEREGDRVDVDDKRHDGSYG